MLKLDLRGIGLVGLGWTNCLSLNIKFIRGGTDRSGGRELGEGREEGEGVEGREKGEGGD